MEVCWYEPICERLRGQPAADRPAIIAISGFGGAGKSTLAKGFAEHLANAEVISAYEFIVGGLTGRCDDWGSVDRERLREEVLQPARAGHPVRYQMYDWPNDRLGDWRTVEHPSYLVVEGIGIVHPDLRQLFDLAVWIDIPLAVATERGRRRDKDEYGVDHDALWRDLWLPNDSDYFERFRPDLSADLVIAPPPLP